MALDEKNIGYQESFLDENGNIKPKFDNTKNEITKISSKVKSDLENILKREELNLNNYYAIDLETGNIIGQGKKFELKNHKNPYFLYKHEKDSIKEDQAELNIIYDGKNYIFPVRYEIEKITNYQSQESYKIIQNIELIKKVKHNYHFGNTLYSATNKNGVLVYFDFILERKIAKIILSNYKFNKFLKNN